MIGNVNNAFGQVVRNDANAGRCLLQTKKKEGGTLSRTDDGAVGAAVAAFHHIFRFRYFSTGKQRLDHSLQKSVVHAADGIRCLRGDFFERAVENIEV